MPTGVNTAPAKTFTVNVTGTGAFDDSVTWTVTDNTSGNTKVVDGLLTVAGTEAGNASDQITVTVTSVADPTKSASAIVTVIPAGFGTNGGGTDEPTGASRVLSKTKAGDPDSDWIEIARTSIDGEMFSLILRKKAIGSSAFGSNNTYIGGTARANVNNWFKNPADTGDKLPLSARMRDFTVNNNLASAIGSYGASAAGSDGYGVFNGFSKPVKSGGSFDNDGTTTDDIAFLLSYGEAARFCSINWYFSSGVTSYPSNSFANANWTTHLAGENGAPWWPRSPGSTGIACNVTYAGNATTQSASSSNALRPACWVHSEIFN